jgi:FkbM family methyltransferase
MTPILKLLKKTARYVLNRITSPPPSQYTPITTQYIAARLPANPVIVEAGAHDGGDTVELAAILGSTVHCFEPIPAVFAKLAERTSHLANVHRYPCALGDREGTIPMFVSSGRNDASSSVLKPKHILTTNPDVLFQSRIDVDVTTLDYWAAKHGITKVDFLWLDMQGYELSAMRAGCKLLETVSVIYTEVSFLEVYEGVPLYHDVWNWLTEKGFRVEKGDFLWPEQGNVLFVRH